MKQETKIMDRQRIQTAHCEDAALGQGREDANQTECGIPAQSLLQAFIRQAEGSPDSIALIGGDGRCLTYGETAGKAALVARALQKGGLRPGDAVTVSLQRGFGMICAVLGVLWAGGVYVPVSPGQPVLRRKSIYKQAGIRFCLTEEGCSALDVGDCINILPDELPEPTGELPEPYPVDPEQLAYIIFTSGSTGTPKGVAISHEAAWNTIADLLERFDFTRRDCALAVSALDFDLSVFDIFGLLSVGGRLVLLSDHIQKEADQWLLLMRKHGVTVWNSVPAYCKMLLESMEREERLSDLRLVLLSGDWIAPELYGQLRHHCENLRFIALGGATEASIWSNFFEVQAIGPEWTAVPYGKPLANQKFRVVREGKDAADYEVGELWIGGRGLAKGYVGAPELTDAAFVMDAGERWYRTGDLGYYLPDGNLIFCGRMDNQVKINGFRIELGEIESKLAGLPGIAKAAALVKDPGAGDHLVIALEAEPPEKREPVIRWLNAEIPLKEDRALEEAVPGFMLKVLFENGHYAPFMADNQLPDGSKAVIRLWEKDLMDRGLLRQDHPENGGDRLTDSARALLLESRENCGFCRELQNYVGLYREILAGDVSPLVLLDDPMLAPSALLGASPVIQETVRQFAHGVLRQMATAPCEKTEPFTVVLWSGRQGEIFKPLLDAWRDRAAGIRLIYMESSDLMLDAARRAYAGYSFDIAYVKSRFPALPAVFAGCADAVVAVNSLHTFHSVPSGLSIIQLLLKKQGVLYAAESRELTGAGAVTAAVIEEGFALYDAQRRSRQSPMLPPEQWVRQLEEAGFAQIEATDHAETNLFTFAAQSGEKSIPPEAALNEYCGRELLAYMVPEKMVYTVQWPLTGNGKLDRKGMAGWFDSEETAAGAPPETESEKQLAALWSALLNREQVYREQNFFELGGDSLLGTRLLTAVRQNMGLHISMRELFDQPCLKDMAQLMDEKQPESEMEEGEL